MNRIGPAIVAMIFSAASGTTQSVGIQQVAWLQGCWELALRDQIVEEQWLAPRGDSMVGVSRTVRGDKLVAYELTVIREQGNRLAYEAHPSGQPSAVFLSRDVSESTVVFENPAHDFPQRIGYQRSDSNALLAWIEGIQQGKPRRNEFAYRRTACPGR